MNKPNQPNLSPRGYHAIREVLGFSQRELAEKLGVDIRTVQRRETGEILITNEAVLALTSLLPLRK